RPDKPVFSRNVCNDRIKSVRINLVGDNLGAGVSSAFIRLAHGGTNYLRSCSDVTALVPYDLPSRGNLPRSARVQAGINMPSPANLNPTLALVCRALLAGPWELVIDQRASYEPTNTKLDISGLDDIELIIEHESFT